MRAVISLAEQETRYAMNSPLLFGVLQALDPESRAEVLDLAPANAELLDYFAAYRCKLHLPGCRDALLKHRIAEDATEYSLSAVFNSLVPFADDDNNSLDLILLWDLPNYLDKRILSAFVDYLMPRLDHASVLHTYIHTRQNMPEYPGEFRLTQNDSIMVDMPAAWSAHSPMYYQELLHKVFAPFRVIRGMLLANGLQEYILAIK
jgi:hypothetical protein